MSYGADPNMANNRGETPAGFSRYLEPDQRQSFLNVISSTLFYERFAQISTVDLSHGGKDRTFVSLISKSNRLITLICSDGNERFENETTLVFTKYSFVGANDRYKIVIRKHFDRYWRCAIDSKHWLALLLLSFVKHHIDTGVSSTIIHYSSSRHWRLCTKLLSHGFFFDRIIFVFPSFRYAKDFSRTTAWCKYRPNRYFPHWSLKVK